MVVSEFEASLAHSVSKTLSQNIDPIKLKLKTSSGLQWSCWGSETGTHQPQPSEGRLRFTQVHLLLSGVLRDTPEHDAGQHGAEEQREAAGHPLHTCEAAPRRVTKDRVPDMSVLEARGGFCEKQVAVGRQKRERWALREKGRQRDWSLKSNL